MGAGGSTAASCSSLDIANHKQHYRRQRQQQLLLMQQDHRNRKLLTKANPGLKSPSYTRAANNGSRLKQSSSHFDLSQDFQVMAPMPENKARNMQHLKAHGSNGWFDMNQSEVYSLSNANFKVAGPVRVLPSPHQAVNSTSKISPPIPAKLTNHHRSNVNKKFSDSLPSLNTLLDHQISPTPNYHPKPKSNAKKYELPPNGSSHPHALAASDHRYHLQHAKQQQKRISNQNNKSAKLMHDSSCDNSYQHRPSPPYLASHDNVVSRQMIKTVSLSSLHNIHSNSHHYHHQHPHPHQDHHHHHPYKSHRDKQQQELAQLSNQQTPISRQQLVSKSNMKVSNGSNHRLSYDFQQPVTSHLAASAAVANKAHHQVAQNSQSSNPLTKRIFRQVTQVNGHSSEKYKRKQHQKIIQQQVPVLPPLPRSQSLHELIQLRSTENGQRMRTNGTLRGPLAGNGEGNKVNLVVELLENRRQQKISEETRVSGDGSKRNNSTETMTSQSSESSSTDDGIHDVSLSVDQSTGDSRQQFSASGSNSPLKSDSLSPLSGDEPGGRQRYYKKNTQPVYSHHKRFSQQHCAANQQQQQSRPQSQKLESNEYEGAKSVSQAHKSTLKRSLSHSALHSNLSSINLVSNNDGNESDDLNELAKFLYQFKQRQETAIANNKNYQVEKGRNLDKQSSGDLAGGCSSSNSSSSHAANLHQSPTSTTSSSGFASSTCTSNSITSFASDEINGGRQQTSKNSSGGTNNESSGNKKLLGRKKYPAPPRPNEQRIDQLHSKRAEKNLISCNLNLSSSLLSIVDEYTNSTLQSNEQDLSVLLGEQVKLKSNQVSATKYDHESAKNNDHSHEQLERLRRYTELRQMSQSELALNHLISSSSPSSSMLSQKGQQLQTKGSSNGSQSNSKNPYKSKFINIIRRISDKSETATPSVASGSSCGGSVGGSIESRAINQRKVPAIVSYPNQHKQPQQQQQQHAKYSPTKAQAETGSSKETRLVGQSLCDLNYDCDLALIKNCGLANEDNFKTAALSEQQVAAVKQQQLLGAKLAVGRCAANGCQKEKKQQKVINSSKAEKKTSNNWRLVPALAMVDRKRAAPAGGCCSNNNNNHHRSMNGNGSGERDCCLVNGHKLSLDKTSAANGLQQQPTKSKWSAIWPNGSASKSSKASNVSSEKNKKQHLQQQVTRKDESGKSGGRFANCLADENLSCFLTGVLDRSLEDHLVDDDSTDSDSGDYYFGSTMNQAFINDILCADITQDLAKARSTTETTTNLTVSTDSFTFSVPSSAASLTNDENQPNAGNGESKELRQLKSMGEGGNRLGKELLSDARQRAQSQELSKNSKACCLSGQHGISSTATDSQGQGACKTGDHLNHLRMAKLDNNNRIVSYLAGRDDAAKALEAEGSVGLSPKATFSTGNRFQENGAGKQFCGDRDLLARKQQVGAAPANGNRVSDYDDDNYDDYNDGYGPARQLRVEKKALDETKTRDMIDTDRSGGDHDMIGCRSHSDQVGLQSSHFRPAEAQQQRQVQKCHKDVECRVLHPLASAKGVKCNSNNNGLLSELQIAKQLHGQQATKTKHDESCRLIQGQSTCCSVCSQADIVRRRADTDKNMNSPKQAKPLNENCANNGRLAYSGADSGCCSKIQKSSCECCPTEASCREAADFHTFTKTSALSGKDLRNQLITQDRCICHSNSATDNPACPSCKLRSAGCDDNVKSSGLDERPSPLVETSSNNYQTEATRVGNFQISACVRPQGTDPQVLARLSECKAVTCRHCSSSKRDAAYDEDINLNQTVCVNDDNLISGLRQQLLQPALGRQVSNDNGEPKNCANCKPALSSRQHQPNCQAFRLGGCASRENAEGVIFKTNDTSDSLESNLRQACQACQYDGKRLSAVRSPICRSNSELGNGGFDLDDQKLGMRQVQPPKGQLRDSLLSERTGLDIKPLHLGNSTKLSCSQANYYIASPLTDSQVASRQQRKSKQAGSAIIMAKKMNVVDDNFILKRKTPDAGLKLHG